LRRLLVVVSAALSALLVSAGAAQAADPNNAPAIPSRLSASGIACGAEGIFIGTTTPEFTAHLDDPDFHLPRQDTVTPTFALWPVGRPDRRIEWSGTPQSYAGLSRWKPDVALTNGMRYRFKVRATDAAGTRSRWSATCTFTVDTIRPDPPTVTSTDYPTTGSTGGPGIPGSFTFAVSGGDTDVTAFRWGSSGAAVNEVPVGPDGKATIRFTPATYGTNVITVQAIDRTLNRSAETTYTFVVRNTEPRLTDLTPDAGPGEPHTFRVAPGNLGNLVSYDYRLNDEPATTIAAGADGTATFTVTPTRPGQNTVTVTGHTADGLPTGPAERGIYLVYTPPTVTSPDFPEDGGTPPVAGQEVTLIFHPGLPGVTEYIWSTDFGATEQVTPAGPDGTATVRYTTGEWPYLLVQIRSRSSNGIESAVGEYGWELTPA
jgi:hypothetical protein